MAKKKSPDKDGTTKNVGKGEIAPDKKKKRPIKIPPKEKEPKEDSDERKKKKKTPVKSKGKSFAKKKKTKSSKPDDEKPKRKRKVKLGRPKKRGRKKGSKNKVINTYVHIRSLCWQKYKGLYKSFYDDEFLFIVKEVHNECKSAGSECEDEDYLQWFEDIKAERDNEGGKRRKKPFIPPDFYRTPTEYWYLGNVEFEGLDNYVWLHSPLIMPAPHMVQAIDYATSTEGRYKGYSIWFSEWVNFCNRVHKDNGWKDSSEECRIFFMITDAYLSPEGDKWLIDILPCTKDGIVDDFGYEPIRGEGEWTPPEEGVVKEEITGEVKVPEVKGEVKGEAKPEKITAKEVAEIEEIKKEGLLRRLELSKKGLLEEKDSLLGELKVWKELGEMGEYEAAKKRIKDVIERIAELNKKISELHN